MTTARTTEAVDTDALARGLVARGLASPRILESTGVFPDAWQAAVHRKRRASR